MTAVSDRYLVKIKLIRKLNTKLHNQNKTINDLEIQPSIYTVSNFYNIYTRESEGLVILINLT